MLLAFLIFVFLRFLLPFYLPLPNGQRTSKKVCFISIYIYYFRLSLPDYLLEQRCGVGAAPYHFFFPALRHGILP